MFLSAEAAFYSKLLSLTLPRHPQEYVLDLPNQVAATPYGQTLLSFLANFETAAAAHDAENPTEPTRANPTRARSDGPSCRRRCGPHPAAAAAAFGLPPWLLMMQGPFGGAWDGCGPCGPAACRGGGPRSARRPHPAPAPTNQQAAGKPSTSRDPPPTDPPPTDEELHGDDDAGNPFAACLADLINAVRTAGRDDLLDDVLAEHHAVLDSLRDEQGAGDVDMPEAPKKGEEESFEVVQ